MTHEEFYGSALDDLKLAKQQLLELVHLYSDTETKDSPFKAVVYCCSRIKSPSSVIQKLERLGFAQTVETALTNLYDVVGIRVVCSFAEDVYRIVAWLKKQSLIQFQNEKDYYAYPKPNGYRSYHVQLKVFIAENKVFPAEIQVRTIATDFWATLEHQIKYKKNLPHETIIRNELKQCADEIASVDLSMQTIRDVIRESLLIAENKEEGGKHNGLSS